MTSPLTDREAFHSALAETRRQLEKAHGIDLSHDGDTALRDLLSEAAARAIGAYTVNLRYGPLREDTA